MTVAASPRPFTLGGAGGSRAIVGRLVCVSLIIACIVGLELVSPH